MLNWNELKKKKRNSNKLFGSLQVLHKPPVITEETEVDTDEVEDEVTSNQTTTIIPTPTTALVLKTTTGTRKRPVSSSGGSGGTVDADSSPTPGKRHGGTTPMRTRQRNVSNSMKNNSKSGIGITESSRSSIISSKNKNWQKEKNKFTTEKKNQPQNKNPRKTNNCK